MIFRQILHPATGYASYVFGCTGKGKLAVVDPHTEHSFNMALQFKDRAEFIAFVQQNQIPAPAEFTAIRQANVEGQVGTLA